MKLKHNSSVFQTYQLRSALTPADWRPATWSSTLKNRNRNMKRKSAVINVGVVTQKKVMYYTVLYFFETGNELHSSAGT